MYVFHLQFALLGVEWIAGPDRLPLVWGSAIPMRILVVTVGVLLTYGAAYLSWHLYEKHFLKLKRHFERRRPRLAPATAAERTHQDEPVVMPAP
jgi:peptidoglycan/LPS O-acetylase OafA/YrhL